MTVDQATDLVRESLMVMLIMSSPILVAALVIGLLVSVFQAATQIQEQTLSFVPKIVGMALATILLTPWLATLILEFAERMFRGVG